MDITESGGSGRRSGVMQPDPTLMLPDLGSLAAEGRPAAYRRAAECALAEAKALVQPAAVWAGIEVSEAAPLLAGLPGKVAAQVEAVTGAVCTIGETLEAAASAHFQAQEYLLGYLLDQAGTLAVARLARYVADLVRQERGAARWAPGDDTRDDALLAQRVLFERVPAATIGVRLTEQNVMVPAKSLSFILLGGSGFLGARCLVPCRRCVWNGNCSR